MKNKPSRISRSQSMLCAAMIAHLDKRIHNESRYSFPDSVTLHKVKTRDGIEVSLLVGACETFGHALARTNVKDSDVSSVEVVGAPIWYEPDYASATR